MVRLRHPHVLEPELPVRGRLLTGQHLPPALAFAHIKDGEDCAEWQSAVQTMDDLIWSVALKTGAEEQQRLVGMLPDLLKRLKNGMSQAGMTPR